MPDGETAMLHDRILDAAQAAIARQGIANLTLDAVAAEAAISKGGLLHHYPSKDRLVEALVTRCAESWRACYTAAYERTPEGPGRMARALLGTCLSDTKGWTERVRRSSSTVFAALAQNPSLIEPMREAQRELHRRMAADGLPPGIGETIAAAIDGLWLDWVLGLVPVDHRRLARVRGALESMLDRTTRARTSSNVGNLSITRSGGRRS